MSSGDLLHHYFPTQGFACPRGHGKALTSCFPNSPLLVLFSGPVCPDSVKLGYTAWHTHWFGAALGGHMPWSL